MPNIEAQSNFGGGDGVEKEAKEKIELTSEQEAGEVQSSDRTEKMEKKEEEWIKVVEDKMIDITEPGTLFHFTDYKYFDSIWENGIKEGSAVSLGPTTW